MILVLVGILAVVVGLVRGGRLEGLSALSFRGETAIIALFLVQFLIRQVAPSLVARDTSLWVWLWCAISVGLLALCAWNWRIAGMPVVFLGIALNLLVVTINVGMPVGGSLAASAAMIPGADSLSGRGGFYRPVDSATLVPILGDVIPVPAPRPFRSLVSLGDVLMFVGVGIVIEEGIRKGQYQARHSAKSSRSSS